MLGLGGLGEACFGLGSLFGASTVGLPAWMKLQTYACQRKVGYHALLSILHPLDYLSKAPGFEIPNSG